MTDTSFKVFNNIPAASFQSALDSSTNNLGRLEVVQLDFKTSDIGAGRTHNLTQFNVGDIILSPGAVYTAQGSSPNPLGITIGLSLTPTGNSNVDILTLPAQTNYQANTAFTQTRNIAAITSTSGTFLNVIPTNNTSVGPDPIISVNLLIIRNIGQPWEY